MNNKQFVKSTHSAENTIKSTHIAKNTLREATPQEKFEMAIEMIIYFANELEKKRKREWMKR